MSPRYEYVNSDTVQKPEQSDKKDETSLNSDLSKGLASPQLPDKEFVCSAAIGILGSISPLHKLWKRANREYLDQIRASIRACSILLIVSIALFMLIDGKNAALHMRLLLASIALLFSISLYYSLRLTLLLTTILGLLMPSLWQLFNVIMYDKSDPASLLSQMGAELSFCLAIIGWMFYDYRRNAL